MLWGKVTVTGLYVVLSQTQQSSRDRAGSPEARRLWPTGLQEMQGTCQLGSPHPAPCSLLLDTSPGVSRRRSLGRDVWVLGTWRPLQASVFQEPQRVELDDLSQLSRF